ncbi:MAG: hypothetical protein ACTS43_00290 [Candidatus Hodgkinia cicadicola]
MITSIVPFVNIECHLFEWRVSMCVSLPLDVIDSIVRAIWFGWKFRPYRNW